MVKEQQLLWQVSVKRSVAVAQQELANIRGQSHRLFLDEQNKTNTVMQPMNAGYRTGGGSVRVLHILTLAVSRNFRKQRRLPELTGRLNALFKRQS
ncbi:hypothetical protein T4A_3026 [Trichinella pseudospiralis]|uniref:Uncharacterized protein n=1 Tax=Trichinella pseudospiralis TaxID=6337 RepID=A0A0V1IMU0_TRIPS|nr:hypothetical protein T4A_3026 [Trichinella pseudospiralis]KRZ24142.1 hypothetical protein T4C_1708 [Trichinella pseudospiralis]